MQVLLLDKMAQRVDRCLIGFMQAGVQVMGSGSVAVADTCLQRCFVDLLVITTEAAGSGTRTLIGTAETRNPNVATILLAADVARATDIAAQSLPSVHCILSADSPPEQIVRFALASLRPTPLTPAQTLPDLMAGPETPVSAPRDAPTRALSDAPPPPPIDAATPGPHPDAPVFSSRRGRSSLAPTARAA
jgi:hypothetical protein